MLWDFSATSSQVPVSHGRHAHLRVMGVQVLTRGSLTVNQAYKTQFLLRFVPQGDQSLEQYVICFDQPSLSQHMVRRHNSHHC